METYDYIVIGSGIAGLHTAYRLQQQGKKVLVLEGEPHVGGRMITREVDGHRVDYGAKFITNQYKNMIPLAKELGIKPVPTNLVTFSVRRDGKLYPFDGRKRSSFLFWKAISFKAKMRMILALLFVLIKYRKLDPYNFETYLYLDDKSVYDDFRRLAGAEAFDYIIEPLSQDVVFYDTKHFSRASFYSLLTKLRFGAKTFSFPHGIGQLCQKMAEDLFVELNTKVKSVQRTPGGVIVTALRNGQEVVYQTKNAVLAVPGNRVLDILVDPLPEEKAFFSHVKYASSIQIIAEADPTFHSRSRSIWTVPKEHPNFSALSIKPWHIPDSHASVFHVSLRGMEYHHLIKEHDFDRTHLKSLIHKEFSWLNHVKIIDMQVWESATPEVYPGYLTKVYEFINRPNWDSGIYFCGDYLENPSTEGALTSSVKLLEKINAQQ